jgi:hypothetical protein
MPGAIVAAYEASRSGSIPGLHGNDVHVEQQRDSRLQESHPYGSAASAHRHLQTC